MNYRRLGFSLYLYWLNHSVSEPTGNGASSSLLIVTYCLLTEKSLLTLQFAEICQRLLNSYNTKIDEFFSEINSSVAASQNVFQELNKKLGPFIDDAEWEKIQRKVGFRGRNDLGLRLHRIVLSAVLGFWFYVFVTFVFSLFCSLFISTTAVKCSFYPIK